MSISKYSDVKLFQRLLNQARPYCYKYNEMEAFKKNIYIRIFSEIRPHMGKVFLILILSFLSTPLALLSPLPVKIVVDSVIGNKHLPSFIDNLLPTFFKDSSLSILLFSAILVVTIAILSQLNTLTSSLLNKYTEEKILISLRSRLLSHVQNLSLKYHDSIGISDSIYRIQYDAPSLIYILIHGFIPFFTRIVTFLSMLFIIFKLNSNLAIIAVSISPILILIASIRKRLLTQSRKVKKRESESLSIIQEALSSLRIVKAFGQETKEIRRFTDKSEEGFKARFNLSLRENILNLLTGSTISVGVALVLYFGGRDVLNGYLSLGNLVLILGYLYQFYEPVSKMSKRILRIQSHLASVERYFSLIDEMPEVSESEDAKKIIRSKGYIEFRNVCFSYNEHNQVLNNITFSIRPGSKVGIVGKTGTGKTTLINLLIRFYEPSSGQILLDGENIAKYKVKDLRNQFSIVLQEPILLSATVAENISYARLDASRKEIIEAAKVANAHEFIINLPESYDTFVGEKGMKLSGGERQRISLARAFLKNAPILILDEPTSSVDLNTEKLIIESMEKLTEQRTSFLISHRPQTLENCDYLIYIEDGIIKSFVSNSPEFWKKNKLF